MPTQNKHTQIDEETENYPDLKGPKKGTIPSNYRPITCLPMMWKIFYSGRTKRMRGTNYSLHKDWHILNEAQTENVAMTWIDNKKAYDVIPQK